MIKLVEDFSWIKNKKEKEMIFMNILNYMNMLNMINGVIFNGRRGMQWLYLATGAGVK